MFHFYIPWIRQKTFGFLTFTGDTEMEHWAKMGYFLSLVKCNFQDFQVTSYSKSIIMIHKLCPNPFLTIEIPDLVLESQK